MASDARPLSPPASLRPRSEARKRKATTEKLKIPAPDDHVISSVELLAALVKRYDPQTEWLQSKGGKNLFLQHARDAVMKVLDTTSDGLYTTTWSKAGTAKRAQMLANFIKREPKLAIFADHWAAEQFLSKCIRNKNVKRSARRIRLDELNGMIERDERTQIPEELCHSTSDSGDNAQSVTTPTPPPQTPDFLRSPHIVDDTQPAATPLQTCPKCNELKAATEFISDKTGLKTVKCKTCRPPKPKTVRDNTRKRKTPASRKAAENTEVVEELEEVRLSKKARTLEKRDTQTKSVAAQQEVRRTFGKKRKA